eukprot:13817882-Alexandrium_andersonii.AAC.1
MFAAGGCRPVTIDPDLWSVAVACAMFAARPCVLLARAESEHVPGLAAPPRKFLGSRTDAAPQA